MPDKPFIMKLRDFTWSTYRIPFCRPFITAHGALSERCGAIVTVRTDAGYVGNGEIAPLPTQSGASLGAALSALDSLARELRGRELADILRFFAEQNSSQESQLPSSLVCGLETALLDACGQASGQSIATMLASGYPLEMGRLSILPRSAVPVNEVIGAGSTEDAVKRSLAAVHAGFTCLKLKLTDPSSATVQRVAAVRAAIGPEPRLRLDANACWSFEQAHSLLTQCTAYDIQYVEQPLPAHDLAGMARLRRVSPIPLAVDEALTGLESARRVLDAEAADVLILKPQLAGGLRAGRQIIQESSQRNVVCVVTSTLEAGIGVAAALHLAAASPEITMACGLATLDLLVDDLLCDGLLVSNGHIHVPAGPGLGVQLDEAALKCYTA
jgi:o-succinylbenzoate synthase